MQRVAFLDRDGTLVRHLVSEHRGPRTPEEILYLPGAVEGCLQLAQSGYTLAIVTNQPDVARGHIDRVACDYINHAIAKHLGIRRWYACYHDNKDHCGCRKPRPGLIYAAAHDLDADMRNSIMIGDSSRDQEAANSAGVMFLPIETNGSLLEALR